MEEEFPIYNNWKLKKETYIYASGQVEKNLKYTSLSACKITIHIKNKDLVRYQLKHQ